MKRQTALTLAMLGVLSACAVGPDYMAPADPIPAAFRENPGWKEASPADETDRGPWWSVFGDGDLDGLEARVEVSNQNLRAQAANFAQARAVLEQANAGFWPTLNLDFTAERNGQGAARAGGATITTGSGQVVTQGGRGHYFNQFDLTSPALSWDIDVWGRIRRTVEESAANTQASAADLANATLSAQSQLAQDYFQLRVVDETQRLLEETVDAFTRALAITQNRYKSGTAAKSDVAQAQAQLENTRAQLIQTGVTRAQFEYAIALLVGAPAPTFHLPPKPFTANLPPVPTGVPSRLLERRPDIASAERKMAAANAQIGVTIAGFFPDLSLTGAYNTTSTVLGTLLTSGINSWSVGPRVAQTLFDGGFKWYAVAAARQSYQAAQANYRQAVLTAFAQVETQLAALRFLAQEAEVQAVAVKDAVEAEQLILNQYKAGTQAYTAVITAQTTTLTSKQNALNIERDQLDALVSLIQALGGGWNRTAIDLANAG